MFEVFNSQSTNTPCWLAANTTSTMSTFLSMVKNLSSNAANCYLSNGCPDSLGILMLARMVAEFPNDDRQVSFTVRHFHKEAPCLHKGCLNSLLSDKPQKLWLRNKQFDNN